MLEINNKITLMSTGAEGQPISIVPETTPPDRGLSQVDKEFKAETFTPRGRSRWDINIIKRNIGLTAAVLTLSALGIACGSKVQAGERPTAPEATATAFAEQNPNATYKVYLPIVTNGPPGQETNTTIAANPASAVETSSKTSEPAPILSPSSEVKKSSIPPEAEQILGDLVSITKTKPNVLNSEEIQILRKGFEERDWPNAKNDIKKFGAYSNLYSSLWARYNVTKDPSIKEEMSKIEGFLKQTWPGIYGTGEGFLRE